MHIRTKFVSVVIGTAALMMVGSGAFAASPPTELKTASVSIAATPVIASGVPTASDEAVLRGPSDSCGNRVEYILGGNRFIDVPGASLNDPECSLRQGNTGRGVVALQSALNSCYGQGIAVDGQFGAGTRQALINVQGAIGTSQDGIYGNGTRNAMRWPQIDGGGNYSGSCYTFAFANQFPKNNI